MPRFELYDLEKAAAENGHVSWQKTMQVSARLTRLRSRPTLQRGRETVVLTHQARLRRVVDIAPGMRLRQAQRVLIIHEVDAVGRRGGWLSCLCEELRSLAPTQSGETT